MYYGEIKYCDIANGVGVRTSLFVSGCRNHCKGCFQPQTWDFFFGQPYTSNIKNQIIESLKPDYINGLSILGGDPFEVENIPDVLSLVRAVREEFGFSKDIWIYTGYIYEKLKTQTQANAILDTIDILVDGPFIEEKKDISLPYRGSSNQRIIQLSNHLTADVSKYITDKFIKED